MALRTKSSLESRRQRWLGLDRAPGQPHGPPGVSLDNGRCIRHYSASYISGLIARSAKNSLRPYEAPESHMGFRGFVHLGRIPRTESHIIANSFPRSNADLSRSHSLIPDRMRLEGQRGKLLVIGQPALLYLSPCSLAHALGAVHGNR